VAETILIELVVDDSQLQPAIDLLEKTGQIDSKLAGSFRQTTSEINKQAQAIKNDNAALVAMQKNFDALAKELKEQNQFLLGFKEGIEGALKDAGVSLEEFFDALKNGPPAAEPKMESLKSRLRGLTEELAVLKANGEDNTEQFQKIAAEAGRLQDAIGDARQEVKNLASDTGVFDGLISGVQGLAGGFAVVQGATALFGDESEELQKTLLKVNAAMSILQGLQQVQTVLQKESAAARLLDVINTKAQVVIQKIYTAVTGQATAATTAFKIALATTGIGLLVVGVLALVQALNEQDDALENVNSELERNKALIEADTASIERRTEIAVAEAQKTGKAESDITRIRGRSLLQQRELLVQGNRDLARLRDQLDSGSEAWFKYNEQIESNKKAIDSIDTKLIIENLNLQKQIQDETKKAAEEAKKAAEERAAKAREARLRELNDQLALLERQLLNAEEGGEEELRIKQKIVAAKARIELEGENLTKNQKLLIREKSAQEQIELERDRTKRLTAEAIAGQISLNSAVLASVKTSDEDRLLLQISNIELSAQAEINAAEGNANKIKEIIAKRDADIAALRKTFIDQQAQQEIDLLTATEGANNRALQRLAQDEKQSVQRRITALQQLAEFELNVIERREQALEDQLAKGLISEEEYNLRYAQLQDEKAKLSEDIEKKITDIHLSENEKRKQAQREFIELSISTAQQVLDVVGQLNDLQTQRDQERLEGKRAEVQELLENGAITEKEAIARNKRIDAEEKKLKAQAAQRDKNIAIFNAVINTAAAVTKALPNLVLAGIAAALGAAQIAIIASRPIPKFKGGKKNRYEGPGIIGEAGSEIFEIDGKRYLAEKETLVWLGKNDKVYTPQETRRMLPSVNKEAMSQDVGTASVMEIDYEALGQAVGKHVRVPGITVDNNGFSVYMEDGLNRTRYMDKYYSSK